MYYALTVNADQIITGVHESVTPILTDTFSENPELADNTVVTIPTPADYQTYTHILCYDEDGALRPLIDRINEGLTPVPQGYELIDGELVLTEVPEAEALPTLMARVLAAESKAESAGVSDKAVRVMFRALAQTDVIKPADALDNTDMFPLWDDCIGQQAKAGAYYRHDGQLWRVNAGQGHTIQADWAPDKAVSLFSLAANPAEEWPEWIQPTGAHNAYKKGEGDA